MTWQGLIMLVMLKEGGREIESWEGERELGGSLPSVNLSLWMFLVGSHLSADGEAGKPS